MNTRRINLTLWATAAVLAVLAVTVVAVALLVPPSGKDEAMDGGPAATSRPGVVAAAAGRLPALSAFGPAWAVRLRGPLVASTRPADPAGDAAAAGPAPAMQPSAVPPVSLVGTIGDAVAMLRVGDGSVQVRAVGETVAGAGTTLLAVRPSQVDVRYNGQVVTLRKAAGPNGVDPFRGAGGPATGTPAPGRPDPPDGDRPLQPDAEPQPTPEPLSEATAASD